MNTNHTIWPSAAGSAPTTAPDADPFDSALPLQAPQFDKIKETDFQPALREAMTRQRAEIDAIANDPATPTFENTLVAMESSGRMLDQVSSIFFALAQANTDDVLQKIQAEEAPRLSTHHDAIYLDAKLFARVKALHDRRASLGLDPEAAQLLKVTYDLFVQAGAQLSADDQTRLKAINQQLSSLSTDFQQKLLAATNAGGLVVDDEAALDGLPADAIAAAAHAAEAQGLKGKWVIPLHNTTQQPALRSLTDRTTRAELFDRAWTRAARGDANDTRATIVQIAELRAQKAALFGCPNYAAYSLQDQMAKTPPAVETFIRQLVGPARARAAAEAADIQALIDKNGGGFELAPWDWDHYAEQVRKARYDLDDSEIKPYLELGNVLNNGVFYAANRLYGLTFNPRPDIPAYQNDVKVFEVIDADGSTLGLMYFDLFMRDAKSGGAWMGNFVDQSKLLGQNPVIYNVANFTKPAPGQPALLSFDDVVTMFHEFGHALHGLFADQTYPSLSGTNVARDFVEFPSQFNEHWALDPEVLSHYAVHYQTGAPMPGELRAKIVRAARFNKGYDMGESIAAAELDMRWHELKPGAAVARVEVFENTALSESGVDFANVPPRYRSTYFDHIFGGGYAAGYYAYLWTQMLADDAFAWFTAHGGLTRENGQRLRDLVLSRGHALDYAPMFHAFYGKAPDIGPMLENRGLAEAPRS